MAKRKNKPTIRDTDVVYSCVAYNEDSKKTREVDRVRWALHPELDSLPPWITKKYGRVKAPSFPFRVVWDYLDNSDADFSGTDFIDPSCRESDEVIIAGFEDRGASFRSHPDEWLEYLARGEPGRRPISSEAQTRGRRQRLRPT